MELSSLSSEDTSSESGDSSSSLSSSSEGTVDVVMSAPLNLSAATRLAEADIQASPTPVPYQFPASPTPVPYQFPVFPPDHPDVSSGNESSGSDSGQQLGGADGVPNNGDAALYRKAAVLVEDAILLRSFRHRLDDRSLSLYSFMNNYFWKRFVTLVVVMNLLLVEWEPPSKNAASPVLTGSLELFALSVYTAVLLLRFFVSEKGMFKDQPKHWVQLTALVLSFLDLAISIPFLLADIRYVRWSRFFRAWFLVFDVKKIRFALIDICKCVPRLISVYCLLGFVILLWSLMATVLFPAGTSEGDKVFSDFGKTLTEFFILLTTANYPDIMLPAYVDNEASAIFFVFFALLAIFILFNLVLATVYSNFRRFSREEVLDEIELQHMRLARAFSMLSDDRLFITQDQWDHLLHTLKPKYSQQKREFLFQVLDTKGDRVIALEDFFDVVELFNFRIQKRKRSSHLLAKWFPGVFRSPFVKKLRKVITSFWFDLGMNLVIVSNIALIMLRITLDESPLDWVEPVYFGIYALEFALKWTLLGTRAYFAKRSNVFDFIIFVVILVDFLIISQLDTSQTIVTVLMILRLLRAARILSNVREFRAIMRAFGRLAPLILQYAGVSFVFLYCFALLGMELWAGRMPESRDDAVDANMTAVLESSYGQAEYFPVNFNTFTKSMHTLFIIVVVNNWHVVASGYVALDSRWVWLFFIAVYLICVTLIMNIIVAFVLETYDVAQDVQEAEIEDPVFDRLRAVQQFVLEEEDGVEWAVHRRNHDKSVLRLLFKSELEHEVDLIDRKLRHIVEDASDVTLELGEDTSFTSVGTGEYSSSSQDSSSSSSELSD